MNPKQLSQWQIKDLQAALSDLGHKGEVDGLWGPNSDAALKAYVGRGGKAEDLARPRLSPQELYDKAVRDYPVANEAGVLIPFVKNILRINTPLHVTSDGILQQAIALYLNNRPEGADKAIARNGSVTVDLGKNKNGDYLWTQLNGGKNMHPHYEPTLEGALESILSPMSRLFTRPAEHIFGGYSVTETPDSYIISDRYNFNSPARSMPKPGSPPGH